MYLPALEQQKLKELLARHKTPSAVLAATHDLGPRAARARGSDHVLAAVARALAVIDELEVRVLLLGEAEYPARLTQFDDPPPALFARGRLDLLTRAALAVVGSRECTEYGRDMTRWIVPPVARAGVVIVSGLARGIDGLAHAAALDAGGDTIAILGCGIDLCYPPSNRALFNRIASGGLLLTEFAPGTRPFARNFPQRNRIIGSLSNGVLVIEAVVDSGSLSTAARVNGRGDVEVMAVPGPVGRPTSEGTNYLIRDGCHLVTSAADVLSLLKIQVESAADLPQAAVVLEEGQRRVFAALSGEPAHLDRIVERARLPVAEVTLSLLELELAGCARQLPGNRYARPLHEVTPRPAA